MIVVDTNVVAYALIEGSHTQLARQVHHFNSEWRLPNLWRHEFLNILATYLKYKGIDIKSGQELWRKALFLFAKCEQNIEMEIALQIAADYEISAYDAQFIALSHQLGVRCITEDKTLLRVFPGLTMSMKEFVSIHKKK